MKFIDDDYLKHFIGEYRKSISLESNDLSIRLNAVLDYALEICNNREEFFELLSFGNYKLSTSSTKVFDDELYNDIKSSMDDELLNERANKEVEALLKQEDTVVDPFAVIFEKEQGRLVREEVEKLPDDEKKVITELYFNDSYISTLANEMKKSKDYIITLTKSALTHMYMSYGLKYNSSDEENRMMDYIANSEKSPKKGRK